MLFGFFNISASFQGYIKKILTENLNIYIVVYYDDILINTEDPGQPHIEAIQWVLEQL